MSRLTRWSSSAPDVALSVPFELKELPVVIHRLTAEPAARPLPMRPVNAWRLALTPTRSHQ